jgi:hypothetical protein
MNPIREKNVIVTAPLAALNRRLRNRARSSIGMGTRRSQTTKATNRTPAAAKPAMLRPAVQPRFGASMIV